jgi:inhibitor of cysteine peptidase
MKTKPILILTTIVLSILLVACATPAQPQPALQVWVETYCDDFYNNHHISKTIEVNAGDRLTVVLCSNPTTGFRWSEDAQVSDSGVLKQEVHEFVGPESEPPPPPGTPGLEAWTFQTLKKGSSTVYMEYSRPWEGGEKGEWTFTLDVVVK